MPEENPESGPATVEPEGAGDSDTAPDTISDEAFEQALAALESGGEFDVDGFLAGREEARPEVEEAVRLARDVVVHAPRSTAAPREVAGYEIERELGAGSMGAVFLARQRSLGGRRVALKVLPPSLGLSGRSKARFLNEARALARLDHPGIVGVHDVIDADGIVAFAMDWVPGGSLAGVLAAWRAAPEQDELDVLARCLGVERGTLAATNATAWILGAFARLARALSAVHGTGLLHRDIKPANLLVRADGELLLSDFGLVRDSAAALHTRTGQYVGTLAYSSPEQLRGDQDAVDVRSDLYSFGVTLYETLTLKLPYAARTLAEVQRRAESGLFDAPRRKGVRLPRDLETILGKSLDPDPHRRYAMVADLAEDLERLLAFRPILARPASRWNRLRKALRRNRGVLAAASAGVLVAVVSSIAVGSYLWRTPRDIADLHLQAQLALVSVDRYENLQLPEYDGAKRAKIMASLGESWRANLMKAQDLYTRALARDPLGLFDERDAVTFERGIVALVESVGSGKPDLALLCGLPSDALIARVAQAWTGPGSCRFLTHSDVTAASERDRYALGLFGFLLYDAELAVLGWRMRPLDSPPDALADGALGEIYLTDERPELAYLYLGRAFQVANRSSYLCCELADCAVRLGDLDNAEALLERAGRLPTEDTFELAARVGADLLAKRGDLEGARACYNDLYSRRSGSRLRANFAGVLEQLGDHSLEVHVRVANANGFPGIVRYQKDALDAAERWWCSLGREARWSRVRELLDGNQRLFPDAIVGQPPLLESLRVCRARYESLPASRGQDEPPPRIWQPLRCGPNQAFAEPGLLTLADELANRGAIENGLPALPPAVRDWLAALWFARFPEPSRTVLALTLVQAGPHLGSR